MYVGSLSWRGEKVVGGMMFFFPSGCRRGRGKVKFHLFGC